MYSQRQLSCMVVGQCPVNRCSNRRDAAVMTPEGYFSMGLCREHADDVVTQINEVTGEGWTVVGIDRRADRLAYEVQAFENWRDSVTEDAEMKAFNLVHYGRL